MSVPIERYEPIPIMTRAELQDATDWVIRALLGDGRARDHVIDAVAPRLLLDVRELRLAIQLHVDIGHDTDNGLLGDVLLGPRPEPEN